MKWARRRPALAVLLGALVTAAVAAAAAGFWLQRGKSECRAVARYTVESDIPRAYALAEEEKWTMLGEF